MGKRVDTVIAPDGADMRKFGHIELAISESELEGAFDFGDILKVTIAGFGPFTMPFFRYYDEVGAGELVLCTYTKHSTAVIARNYRTFGVEIGLLEVDANCGNFNMKGEFQKPVPVTIELEGKAGKQAAFCFPAQEGRYDFRMVSGGKIKPRALFRSSSPIDPRLADSSAVDKRAQECGIRSFVDLADTKEEIKRFKHFGSTYCSQCKTAYLDMPLDVVSPRFKKAIQNGMTFIAESEPPYLVFCSEGRNRTGMFSAMLQCLCGVGLEDVISDYAYSFRPICADREDPAVLHGIEQSLIDGLCRMLGIERLNEGTLGQDMERYLSSIGIEEDVIMAVKTAIGAQRP